MCQWVCTRLYGHLAVGVYTHARCALLQVFNNNDNNHKYLHISPDSDVSNDDVGMFDVDVIYSRT